MEEALTKTFWCSLIFLFLVIGLAWLMDGRSEAIASSPIIREEILESEDPVADLAAMSEVKEIDELLVETVLRENPKDLEFQMLYAACCQVESGNNHQVVGDNGRAVGIVQIWQVVVDDVNKIIGYKKYNYHDRRSPAKCREMFTIYLSHYGEVYQERTGRKPTIEVYAKIWNGGPNGYQRTKTVNYWQKVKKELDNS